jgi:hypothetical protein
LLLRAFARLVFLLLFTMQEESTTVEFTELLVYRKASPGEIKNPNQDQKTANLSAIQIDNSMST